MLGSRWCSEMIQEPYEARPALHLHALDVQSPCSNPVVCLQAFNPQNSAISFKTIKNSFFWTGMRVHPKVAFVVGDIDRGNGVVSHVLVSVSYASRKSQCLLQVGGGGLVLCHRIACQEEVQFSLVLLFHEFSSFVTFLHTPQGNFLPFAPAFG